MKTEAYVDKSLDDFIKANRGMFRRGRGRAPGRGSAARAGGRGGGRGRSPLRGGGRARSGSRGRGGSAARGGGRAARGRGGRAAATARGQRGQRGGRPASFSRTWRASSARMASRVKGEVRPGRSTSNTPVKRKKVPRRLRHHLISLARYIPILHRLLFPLSQHQVAVKAVRGSKLAGRLGATPKGAKRVTSLALQKKRKAMQQLTTTGKQLSRADARNQILMRRRGIQTEPATAGRGRRGRGRGRGRGGATVVSRGALSARTRPPRSQSASARTEQKLPLPEGRVRVYHESAAPEGRARRPLNRNRTPAGDPNSLLTVQIKNDLVVRQPPPRTPRRAPLPLDMDEEMGEYTPPPPPPPPPQQRSPSGLDPRIQQEIAAIQARGRQQHHPSGGRINSSLSGFRPTANVSSRTLNDRFTSDRVIYS